MAIPRKQKRTPRSCSSWGVLVCLAADWAVWFVLRLCIIPVQPLAQGVADCTGHNGNSKGDYVIPRKPSFPLERVAALEIIPKIDRRSNTRQTDFGDLSWLEVMILQNIQTMTELYRLENSVWLNFFGEKVQPYCYFPIVLL